jgi:hypothetical protein
VLHHWDSSQLSNARNLPQLLERMIRSIGHHFVVRPGASFTLQGLRGDAGAGGRCPLCGRCGVVMRS